MCSRQLSSKFSSFSVSSDSLASGQRKPKMKGLMQKTMTRHARMKACQNYSSKIALNCSYFFGVFNFWSSCNWRLCLLLAFCISEEMTVQLMMLTKRGRALVKQF